MQGIETGEVTSGTVSYEPEVLLQQDGAELRVWEERPGVPQKTASQIMWYNIAYEKQCGVPAYDRAVDAPLRSPDPKRQRRASKRWQALSHELSLPVLDGGASLAGGTEGHAAVPGTDCGTGVAAAAAAAAATAAVPRPARRAPNRCFNCGSYAHTARECWREYDREQVEQSRKEFADARGEAAGGPRAAKRYFLGEEGGGRRGANGVLPLEEEFGDVKPGQLSEALRSAMGLGPLDPPPWLNRMRDMGIPPGYRVHKRRPLHTANGAGAEPAASAGVVANGEVQNGSLPHPALLEHPQQQEFGGIETVSANSQEQGQQVSLSPQASLESGEWEDGGNDCAGLGDDADALGDFLAFDEGGTTEQAQKRQQAAEPPVAAPAEDFIPFDSGSPQATEDEPGGSESGAAGQWEGTWVETAQFPGVNAPMPEGADAAKWEPYHSFSQPSQQQQNNTPGSLPRLQRLQGLHPPPPPGQATAGGLHSHFNLGTSSATHGAAETPPRFPNGLHGYTQHEQQQQQQQGWQAQPSRLRHLPSAPAILQHAPSPPLPPPHDGQLGCIYLGVEVGRQGEQEQQQYSPIVRHHQQQLQQQQAQQEFGGLERSMLSHHASLAPLPTQQQQYLPTQQYQQAQQQAYAVPQSAPYQHHPGALALAPQVFGVSAADPGHLLAPVGGLQPPPPPAQQGQLYAAPPALPLYSAHQPYQPLPQNQTQSLQQPPYAMQQPVFVMQQQQQPPQQQQPYQQQQTSAPGFYTGWQ
ncbi:hypothetical protein N2152v2_002964 [Parachlorella kessleri]